MRCDGKKYSGEPACPQVTRLKSKTSFRFIRFLQCKHRGSVRGTFIWTYGVEDWFFLNGTYTVIGVLGNPPAEAIGRPSATRPQDAILRQVGNPPLSGACLLVCPMHWEADYPPSCPHRASRHR